MTLVGVLQPQYVYFTDALYAEALFGLFTIAFFVVRRYRRDTLGFVLCGVCAVLAYEARTAGIALLVAWVVDHALRKETRRALTALVVSALLVASWTSWIKAVESSPEYRHPAYAYQTEPWVYFNVSYARNLLTYFDPWWPELGPLTPSGFLRRVAPNVSGLPRSIGQAVSTWDARGALAIPLGILVLGGLLLQAVRREFAVVLYVVLSLAAMCATPFQKQFVRYLLPLYPLLALALFELLIWATAQARSRWPALPAALGTAIPWLVIVVIALRTTSGVRGIYANSHHDVAYEQHGQAVRYRLFYYEPEGADLDAALDWLDRRAAPNDTLAGGDPQWVYLRTGRRCVRASVRPRRQEGPAADRQRAGEVPARVGQAGRVRAVHGAPPGRKPGRMAAGVARRERHARRVRTRRAAAALSLGSSIDSSSPAGLTKQNAHCEVGVCLRPAGPCSVVARAGFEPATFGL